MDIFEKDYLVIPINERNHWFLAIVCFPGLSGPVTVKDNQPINLHLQQTYAKKTVINKQTKFVTVNGEPFHIGNTTITPVNSNSKVLISAYLVVMVLYDLSYLFFRQLKAYQSHSILTQKGMKLRATKKMYSFH